MAAHVDYSPTQSNDVSEKTSAIVQEFGEDTPLPPPPNLTQEQERKIWRKVDLWLMPMLTLMYLASFMDRGMLNAQDFQTGSV